MQRFFLVTGLDPDEIRARAGTPELLSAVLEHLAGDESLLLVFAASREVAPESIGLAIRAAAGAAPMTAGPQAGSAAPGDRPRRHQDRRRGAGPGRPRARRASHAGAAPRLRRHHRGRRRDGARARADRGRHRQHRHRHAGLAVAGERARAERQLDMAQRPAVPARSRGAARPAGPARQRCQLLCPVGGRRWRGRRRALGVRRDPRHGLRRRARLRRRAHRRSARHRRRVGPQPAALGERRASTRAPSAGAGASAASRPGSPGPASRPITRERRATGFRPRRSRPAPPPAMLPRKPRSTATPAGSPAASPTSSTSSTPT